MKPENELRKIYDSLPKKRSIVNILRAEKYKPIVDFLNNKYPMLSDKKYSIGMKVYWFINGFMDFPKCTECGGPNKTHRCTVNGGYHTTVCSRKCSNGTHKVEAARKTFMEKYGVDNPLKNKEVHERQKQTILEKYGVDNVSKVPEILKKIEEVKLQKYGDRYYVNQEKAKKTNLERYGVENPFNNRDVQEKAKNTMLERYGVKSALQVPKCHDQAIDKSIRFQIHDSYENTLKVNPYCQPAFTEEYYLNHRGKHQEYDFRCTHCGEIYKSNIHSGRVKRCPKCYPTVTTSIKEKELYDFLCSLNAGAVFRRDRTFLENGKELDMMIPGKNIAIEFDGLYWHSEANGIGRKYHLEKTRLCEEKGFQLIHIFEDEWDMKQAIVKSRLASILGVGARRIYARDCDIVEVKSRVEYDFLDKNHMQGKAPSFVCYGLEYKGELVAVMSFSKMRKSARNKSEAGKFELLRFCSKLNCSVVGGAGKLLKHFEWEHHPKEMVSYADRRWSAGKLYEKLGFKFDHASEPTYWYSDSGCHTREHRFAYRKSVLAKKLKLFDPNLSESENMRLNKYTKIWDCGNLVFVKTYPENEKTGK